MGVLSYMVFRRGVKSVNVRVDEEEDVQYVHMEDPSATEITFVRAPCPSKEVMYVQCSELGTNCKNQLHSSLTRANYRVTVTYI